MQRRAENSPSNCVLKCSNGREEVRAVEVERKESRSVLTAARTRRTIEVCPQTNIEVETTNAFFVHSRIRDVLRTPPRNPFLASRPVEFWPPRTVREKKEMKYLCRVARLEKSARKYRTVF